MISLQTYYNTGNDNWAGYNESDEWRAQTFTPAVDYTITSVRLLLFRFGNPGTITVSIKATDVNGKPTGDDLAVGTTSGNTLTTNTDGEWREILLSSLNLEANTQYAIVIRGQCPTTSDWWYWHYDDNDATYSGGAALYNNAAPGGFWNFSPGGNDDLMFEVYGATERPVLRDHYAINDSHYTQMYGDIWNSQGFVPSIDYTLTAIKLLMYRVGSPGDLIVSIQGTDGAGEPDGTDLCSETIDADLLETTEAWRYINFSSPIAVTAGTEYCIVLRALSGDGSNDVRWRIDTAGSYYTSGDRWYTSDGGVIWNQSAGAAQMFETYSEDSTIEEHYTNDSNLQEDISGLDERGQTFTTIEAHTLGLVNLKLYRVNSPGTINVDIYAVDGTGKPTGASLGSGTYNGNSLTTDTDGAWYAIPMSGSSLAADTKYAIVVKASSASASDHVYWKSDDTSPTYITGQSVYSIDGGSTWAVDNIDQQFEESITIIPVVTLDPISETNFAGQLITLYCTATGSPTPTYQWYKDGALISGAVLSSYSFYGEVSDSGLYTCVATNIAGSVESAAATIVIEANATAFTADTRELEVFVDFDLKLTAAVAFDLLSLVPRKFHGKPTDNWFRDYIAEAGLQLGDWLTKIRDIVKLENPYTVSTMKFLRLLGYIIGVEFPAEDSTSELEMRKTLAQAIDWYKLKGTFESVQILALIHQFTINLYGMYTNDYSTFYLTDWFVGDEDENPPGFDNTYYKSPHFGLEIVLNKVLTSVSDRYLWQSGAITNFALRVDETRPVHTVPHFIILLNPKTDEHGNTIEVDGEIFTKAGSGWEVLMLGILMME
jgi:hypothetical protein